jgi:hypothetical protein
MNMQTQGSNLNRLLTAAILLAIASTAPAAEKSFNFTIDSGDHARTNTPARVPLTLPAELANVAAAKVVWGEGQELAAQITQPGLHAASQQREGLARELHFVLPKLAAGQKHLMIATISTDTKTAPTPAFAWHDTPGEYAELTFGPSSRPVLRYMCKPLDESSKEAREQTYKVFHHLYDPAGKLLVTKGPGGQYTHHRGLFFGFNRVSYGDGKKCDVWHCTGDAHQSHDGFLASEAGPVLGRHRVTVGWHGPGKETFATEQRELAVYQLPGGHLVEFRSRVATNVGPVRLDGDPQHAGFHFRAAQEVAEKTKSQTYYLRPDGPGKLGETRNWDPKTGKGPVNLPWNAMSFVIGGKRYTAVYLDHPRNPKEARYSERDYGRFGSYFEYDLTADRPLEVAYRVWLQEGEMTADQCTALSHDFVAPPRVTLAAQKP